MLLLSHVADTFWTNPQYRVEVVDPDKDDDDNMGTVIVALMQKERRKKKREGLDYLTIGFSLYKVNSWLLSHLGAMTQVVIIIFTSLAFCSS